MINKHLSKFNEHEQVSSKVTSRKHKQNSKFLLVKKVLEVVRHSLGNPNTYTKHMSTLERITTKLFIASDELNFSEGFINSAQSFYFTLTDRH